MEPENQAEVWNLIKRVRKELPKKRHLGIFRVSVGGADRERKGEMQAWNGWQNQAGQYSAEY